MEGSILRYTNLNNTRLCKADLKGADLSHANLNNADLTKARIESCKVYGVSVWNVNLGDALQRDLYYSGVTGVTDEQVFSVDSIQHAVVLHLLLKSGGVRELIDTITSKTVLILGRFTPERKAIFDAIREELRRLDYIPILFDFKKPASKDIHETIITLANLAKFIIADITSPKSIPQELTLIVPNNPSLPVKPIIQKGSKPWGMFGYIKRYPWVLDVHEYKNVEDLISSLKKEVVIPAEAKVEEMRKK